VERGWGILIMDLHAGDVITITVLDVEMLSSQKVCVINAL
jgi:hypothetical protein